ncbi:MAG: DUF2079 domain-containing protein [Candidatus Aceula meridiana]|nr:DUF2079 domain-containing protein [Candidatus Aceula meridiana]
MQIKQTRKYEYLVWSCIAIYAIAFFSCSALRFFAFDYYDMDFAVYAQIIWNILHGSLNSSVLGINFIGHHVHLIAFPVALIYKIIPHPLTLLFLQTLVLALGAYPLYLIGRHAIGPRLAFAVSATYLLYPSLGYMNLYEFHFTPFATLALFYMIYFFIERKYLLFIISTISALICQENISLAVLAFGIYALFLRRSPRWWLFLMMAGIAYFLLCAKIILPALNPDTIQFMSIYKHLGGSYVEIIYNIFTHPKAVFLYMSTPEKIYWLTQLFGPLFYLPLASPGYLIPSIPFFMQHLLSSRPQEIDIHLHYTAELIPFIFVSFIFGIKKLISTRIFLKRELSLMWIILAFSIFNAVAAGPHFRLFKKSSIVQNYHDNIKSKLLRKIPKDAAVLATFEFMPSLSNRKNLFSFHHVLRGYYTLSNKPYKLPRKIDYALIDFNDPLTLGSFYSPQQYKNIQALIEEQNLVAIEIRNNFVLFKKGGVKGKPLYKASQKNSISSGKKGTIIDGTLKLNGIKAINKGDTVEAIFDWTALEKTSKDIGIFFKFSDALGDLVDQTTSQICYRIYPTQAWKKGEHISDYKYLVIPPILKGKPYDILIGFYDFKTKRILKSGIPLEISKESNL